MKSLSHFITEKLKIHKNIDKPKHTLVPETKGELKKMIKDEMDKNGNKCSLNHIDVSKITDMSFLMFDALEDFDGDISEWDVSNVKNMSHMFYVSAFTGKNSDISNWDVSSVKDMSCMFTNSLFDGDISGWDVSNVINMTGMFADSQFTGKNGGINNWDVSKVIYMSRMFNNSVFDNDISKWDISSLEDMSHMFRNSKVKCDISDWDVSNVDKSQYAFANSYYETHPKLLPKYFTT